ncbi:MAG: hypothetical protein H6737_32130 [Alphaproteobacteria bacterium]|nr:hypothetical protein [Alphaproteobacteria bacterium]
MSLLLPLLVTTAHGVSCSPPPPSVDAGLFGFPGPLNTAIPVYSASDDVYVIDASGAEVPVEIERIGGFARVRPIGAWEPFAAYTIAPAYSNGQYPFSVTDEVDLEAPQVPPDPTITARRDVNGPVGAWTTVEAELPLAPGDTISVEWQLDTSPGFESPIHGVTDDRQVGFGEGCGPIPAAAYSPEATFYVRAREVDLAGNASDWSEVAEVPPRIEAEAAGGCSTLPGSGAAWLGLLGLLPIRRLPVTSRASALRGSPMAALRS